MEKISRVSVLLISCLFALEGLAYPGWVEVEKPVVEKVGWHYPAVYGDSLLFDTGGGGGEKSGSYLLEISTGKLTKLRDRIGGCGFFGDRLTYRVNKEIYLYNIRERRSIVIGEGNTAPAIYSDLIAYGDDEELVLYNLKEKKGKQEKRVKLPGRMLVASKFLGPAVYEDTIVWIGEKDNGEAALLSYNIGRKKIKEHHVFTGDELINVQTFKFQNGVVLLSNQRDVYIYNMKNNAYKKLTRPGKEGLFLSNINDGKVVWDSNGGETIYVYDIAKDEYTELTASKGSSVYSGTYAKGKLFFVDHSKYELRVFEFKAD